jgi:cytochrome c oxidase cbb3-type subunit 4
MDLNDLRSLVTLASFVLFIGLVAFTWSRRRTASHDAAAALPFLDDAGARDE